MRAFYIAVPLFIRVDSKEKPNADSFSILISSLSLSLFLFKVQNFASGSKPRPPNPIPHLRKTLSSKTKHSVSPISGPKQASHGGENEADHAVAAVASSLRRQIRRDRRRPQDRGVEFRYRRLRREEEEARRGDQMERAQSGDSQTELRRKELHGGRRVSRRRRGGVERGV